jgi:hypothetical protein
VDVFPLMPGTHVAFLGAPAGWFGTAHPAPRRLLFFSLSPEREVATADGEVRHFSPERREEQEVMERFPGNWTESTPGTNHRTTIGIELVELSSPTVVDDRRAHIAACNGRVARLLDGRAANTTRQGGRQKRGSVRLLGERTAAGSRPCSGAPLLGDQKTCGGDRNWMLLVLESSPTAQAFFENGFFPISS